MTQLEKNRAMKAAVAESESFKSYLEGAEAVQIWDDRYVIPVVVGEDIEGYVEIKLTSKKDSFDLEDALADYQMEKELRAAKALSKAKAKADKEKASTSLKKTKAKVSE